MNLYFVVLRSFVLPPNSKSKLIHNRFTSKLIIKTTAAYVHAREQLRLCIVNREDWLGSPANIKVTNKDAKIYVGRSKTLHNLLFSPHTLCMSYVTNTFLLVSSSVGSKQLLCFVQGQG